MGSSLRRDMDTTMDANPTGSGSDVRGRLGLQLPLLLLTVIADRDFAEAAKATPEAAAAQQPRAAPRKGMYITLHRDEGAANLKSLRCQVSQHIRFGGIAIRL